MSCLPHQATRHPAANPPDGQIPLTTANRHLVPARYRTEARRHYYVTPTSYLQLLQLFKALLARQQAAVTGQRRRYEVGLEKLASTEEQVRGRVCVRVCVCRGWGERAHVL